MSGNANNLDNSLKNQSRIGSVNFTQRELDVMACIVGGRTSKKSIASTLNISPRTASTHSYNIMQKLQCSSWEYIRTFIEENGYMAELRALYTAILCKAKFQTILKEIQKVIPSHFVCTLFNTDSKTPHITQQIKTSLELVSIKVIEEIPISKLTTESLKTQYIILTSDTSKTNTFNPATYPTLEELTLAIIRFIMRDEKIEPLIAEYEIFCREIQNENIDRKKLGPQKKALPLATHKKLWLIGAICLGLLGVFFIQGGYQSKPSAVKSELKLPEDSALLKRDTLTSKMNKIRDSS